MLVTVVNVFGINFFDLHYTYDCVYCFRYVAPPKKEGNFVNKFINVSNGSENLG